MNKFAKLWKGKFKMLLMAISVSAFCLTGATIDDCAMVQEVFVNGKSIGDGIVTKPSMARHIRPHSDLPIYTIDSNSWAAAWSQSDYMWEKDVTFIKPSNGTKPSNICDVRNFQFVTFYNFQKGNQNVVDE